MKTKMMLAAAAVCCLSVMAQAAQIAYDGFDYSPVGGSILGQNGGSGWADGWTLVESSGVTEIGEPLSILGASSTGNSIYLSVDSASATTGTGVNRQLSQLVGTPGTTLWGSVMVKSDDVGVSDFFITFGSNSALTIGRKWHYTFSIDNNATTVTQVAGETYQLLFRYDFDGGNTKVYLWVDPDLSSEPDVGSAFATKTGSFDETALVQFRCNKHDAHEMIIDEFTLGTTFEDALPKGFPLVPDMFEYEADEVVDPNTGEAVAPFSTTGTIFLEETVVYEGATSLKAVLGADGTVTKVSEAAYDLSAQSNGKQLSFWFRGDGANDAGDLTLTLISADPNELVDPIAIVYPDVMQSDEWIDLKVIIPENDPNWNSINGLEFKTSSAGTIYIDQLELVAPPAQLVVHWPFDEGAGTTAADMSGLGNDGTIFDNSDWVAGRSGEPGDYALNFAGLDPNQHVISGAIIQPDNEYARDILSAEGSFTIMVWVNFNSTSGNQIIGGIGDLNLLDDAPQNQRVLGNSDARPFFSAGSQSVSTSWGSAKYDAGQWHLHAVTYDAKIDNLRVYIDGTVIHEQTKVMEDVVVDNFMIGGPANIWDNNIPLNAVIDDFKVYNLAMTRDELVLASDGAWYCDQAPEFDISGDCRVDILDFAMIAETWLECERFPADTCMD